MVDDGKHVVGGWGVVRYKSRMFYLDLQQVYQ